MAHSLNELFSLDTERDFPSCFGAYTEGSLSCKLCEWKTMCRDALEDLP